MNDKEESNKESEYIGNIWGWKLSRISLIFILAVFTVFAMRYCYVKKHNPDFKIINTEE